MSPRGYHGKILWIDLSNQTSHVETPDETFHRLYTGPGLIGTNYLLQSTRAGINPFDPENLLTFSSSVIAGNLGTGLARFGVVAKSPLSGGVFESRGEGPFARGLKGSGYDAIVIRGRLEHPGYVLIEQGNSRFHPATDLWGKDTAETNASLEKRHGPDSCVAAIGPAGERLVRFAGIVTAGAHQTQRGGLGAVMGSKNLKALVIAKPLYPEVAEPDAVAELDRLFREDGIVNNALNVWQKGLPGWSYWIDLVTDPGYVAVHNGQSHEYSPPAGFQKEKYMHYFRAVSACPGCANDCIKTFNTGNLTGDDRAGGMNWEVIAALAINLGLEDLETFFDVNTQCLLHGLDPVSLGGVLGFAAECAEKGILSPHDFGFKFGFGRAADRHSRQLVEQIARREGLGAILGEGVRRAAQQIGKGAEQCALHVKGVETNGIEPRCQTNLALGYAVAPGGPQGDICEHDWDFDTSVGWAHTLERTWTLGVFNRVPMDLLAPEKVRNFRVLNIIWSACDGIGLCLYASAPTRYLRLSQMVRMVAAVTGWDFSSYELMRVGERRNALMRCYNYREGFTAADDSLPERFYNEPIRTGRHQGSVIDRARFQEMIQLYYAMMGWDEAGRPTKAKLYDLNLDWLA